MSFILDALRKLERQRQRGSMPDLATVHITNPRKHRKTPLWLYLLLAALILNAGILALLFIPRETDKNILSATSPVEHPNKQVSAVSNQTPFSPSRQSGLSETISPGRHDPDIGEPSSPSESGENHAQRDIQAKQVKPKPVQKHRSLPLSDADIHINLNTRSNNLLDYQPSGDTLSSAPLAAPPVFHQADSNKPASQQDIPDISQLPQSVRSEIPPISILGHIYSDSAETRMVNINGDILREGDTVAKNITIKKITVNGVIFKYGDIRFGIRAF